MKINDKLIYSYKLGVECIIVYIVGLGFWSCDMNSDYAYCTSQECFTSNEGFKDLIISINDNECTTIIKNRNVAESIIPYIKEYTSASIEQFYNGCTKEDLFKIVFTKKDKLNPEGEKFIVLLSELAHFFEKIFNRHSLIELFSSDDELKFYGSKFGFQILQQINYPEELVKILKDQYACYVNIFSQFAIDASYTRLIEVGCGLADNIDLAKNYKLRYLGLDVSKEYIDNCRKNFEKDFEFENIDIFEYLSKYEKKDNDLFLFSFNLLGNIFPLQQLMLIMKIKNISFIASIYKNTNFSNDTRQKYYSSCGYTNIEKLDIDRGVIFKADEGLFSIAYNPIYIEKIFTFFDFKFRKLETDNLHIYHVL